MTTSEQNWKAAAEKLGWEYSPAYGGYIHPNYHPLGPSDQFASYPSDMDAEDACFIDGIETEDEDEAVRLVIDT